MLRGPRWGIVAAFGAVVAAGCAAPDPEIESAEAANRVRDVGSVEAAGEARDVGIASPRGGRAREPAPAMIAAFPTQGPRVLAAGLEVERAGGVIQAREGARPPAGVPALSSGGMKVAFPEDARDAVHFRIGTLDIVAREEGLRGQASIAERAVTYERAGGASFWTAGTSRTEEWLHLSSEAVRAGEPVATWEIEGADLHARGLDAVALRDARGVARLWVTAPVAFGRGGRSLRPRLAVHGSRLELFVDAEGEEVLVDPIWQVRAPMLEGRAGHVMFGLPDGQRVVAGGVGAGYVALWSAELYNPIANAWSPLPKMAGGRYSPSLIPLPDQKVMIIGGGNSDGIPVPAEIFDEATHTWSPGPPGAPTRSFMAQAYLSDGRVLLAGGNDTSSIPTTNADLYDPATGAWKSVASMSTPRGLAGAFPVGNKVIVFGGWSGNGQSPSVPVATTEIYDPATDTWTPGAPMSAARWGFMTAPLWGQGFLVAGGVTTGPGGGTVFAETETYDVASGAWSAAPPLGGPRALAAVWISAAGPDVLLAGGGTGSGDAISPVATAEEYKNGSWTGAASMSVGRYLPAYTSSLGPELYVTGGFLAPISDIDVAVSQDMELYLDDSTLGQPCGGPADCPGSYCTDGVCCVVSLCATYDNPCQMQGVCQPGTGLCAIPSYPDGWNCGGGDLCTKGSWCQSGVCVPVPDVVCPPPSSECQSVGCNPATGLCEAVPQKDGQLCEDGDPCTAWSQCSGGQCAVIEPVECGVQDDCHDYGICNPNNGQCDYPVLPDGTACKGGVCHAGVCGTGGAGGFGGAGGPGGAGGSGGGGDLAVTAGCGCRVAEPRGESWAGVLGLLLATASLKRRRGERRRG